jgi:hypothetical protein
MLESSGWLVLKKYGCMRTDVEHTSAVRNTIHSRHVCYLSTPNLAFVFRRYRMSHKIIPNKIGFQVEILN